MPTTTCPKCAYENSNFSAECEFCKEPLPYTSFGNEGQRGQGTGTTYPSYVDPAYQQPPPPPRFDQAGNIAVANPVRTHLTCVKCGDGHGVELEYVKKQYVPPLIYLAILISPILVVILAMVLKVKHEFNIPFCRECWQKFNRANMIGTVSVFAILGLLIAGAVGGVFFESPLTVLLAFTAAISGLIYGLINKRKNAPVYKKVDGKQVIIDDPVLGDVQFLKT
jgi:hypothetical protein